MNTKSAFLVDEEVSNGMTMTAKDVARMTEWFEAMGLTSQDMRSLMEYVDTGKNLPSQEKAKSDKKKIA